MGSVVRFDFFTSFYVYLPLTKARLPCPLVMAGVTKAAESLGVNRKTFSMLLNEKSGIGPEMALRLSKVFGRTPEEWLRLQLQYDLWKAKQNKDIATHSETYLFTIMKK